MRKAGIVLAAVLAMVGSAQAADPALLKLFAKPPATIAARLSPDGKRVALIATYQGRQVLYVHSLVEGVKDGKIVRTGDFNIRWVRWKDDQHLIAGLWKTADHLFPDSAQSQYSLTRLISVDSAGEHAVAIGEPEGGFFNKGETVSIAAKIHPQHQDNVISILPTTPGRVLQIVLDKFPRMGERLGMALYSVDIATGDHELVDKGGLKMADYVIDKDAVPRIGVEHFEHELIFSARDGREAPWHEIQRVKPSEGEFFNPLALMPDKAQLAYVLTNRAPDGREGLWSFDIGAGRFVDLIDAEADLTSGVVEDGVLRSYRRKDDSRVYFDPAWQADYLTVRKAMKGADVRIVDRSADGSHVLLEVHQPHQPKVWWILDRTVKPLNLWPAVEEYPDMAAEHILPVKEVVYAARDGLKIPGYLTLPKGYREGAIPFIVLPHGGPFVCEGRDFDFESQFLASRGWGVLRPQFRGTSCYGPDFERRGYREWGFAMQDDLTDGTRWLIDQHYADPTRICIVGSSYGGYAALGAVDTYRNQRTIAARVTTAR
jgi:dipeptidyl aminopeptidase/acylaminoacyl peptidase